MKKQLLIKYLDTHLESVNISATSSCYLTNNIISQYYFYWFQFYFIYLFFNVYFYPCLKQHLDFFFSSLIYVIFYFDPLSMEQIYSVVRKKNSNDFLISSSLSPVKWTTEAATCFLCTNKKHRKFKKITTHSLTCV